MSKNKQSEQSQERLSKHANWTVLPIVWLPLFFFLIGPALAGETFETQGSSVAVALITGIVGLVGEIFFLARKIKNYQLFFALVGILSSILLIIYAYLVAGFHPSNG